MEPDKTRPVIICSGGDWTDASFKVIDVPKDLVMDDLNREYEIWLKDLSANEDYLSFDDWLIKQKGLSESGIEEHWSV